MAMQHQAGMVQKVFFLEEADRDKLEKLSRILSVKESQRITVSDLLRLSIKNLLKEFKKELEV